MNFVWAYSREAHPEESPFLAGFETRDLGWEHRYFEPTTMEERAQRARWIRTELEPDAQIPMIIDYINSSLGSDNAIWHAYTGGGFYAGFVIDCDATLIYQENWAWRSPGGQWWNLPLALVEDLDDFLSGYLADPPVCYAQSPARPDPPTPRDTGVTSHRGEGAKILIVDDDGGSAYEGYFKIPLGNLKTHYEVWDVQQSGSPSSEILANYNVIVWLTGDTSADTLTPTDQTNLSAYLEGGGKLFLSGQNIGQDIGLTPFYHDYLHATLIDEDTEVVDLLGEDVLGGLEITISGNEGAGNQNSPSQVGLLDGAVGLLRYSVPGPPAWGGLLWEGDYQVVYFGFGFEGIGNLGAATFRFDIMKKVFAWFDELPCQGDIDFDGDVDLDDFTLLAASMAGPDQTTPPDGVDFTHFAKSDLDLDGDVDCADFLDFQKRFGGSCD